MNERGIFVSCAADTCAGQTPKVPATPEKEPDEKKAASAWKAKGLITILFPVGGKSLDEKSRKKLRILAASLKKGGSLVITGFTDDGGSKGLNKWLAGRRAVVVRDFLMANGVKGEVMKAGSSPVDGYVASNTSPQGRQKNRRVEIRVFAKNPKIRKDR